MEKNKVTKKVSEDTTIDYYFLNQQKVIELIKEFKKAKEKEDSEKEYERETIGFI